MIDEFHLLGTVIDFNPFNNLVVVRVELDAFSVFHAPEEAGLLVAHQVVGRLHSLACIQVLGLPIMRSVDVVMIAVRCSEQAARGICRP